MKNYRILKQLIELIGKERVRKLDFSYIDFSKINFEGANFERANFERANFERTNFFMVNFSWTNFIGTNFIGANFEGANFEGANFFRANFFRANFSRTNFEEANFSGANFEGANFEGANLNIIVNETTTGLLLACPEEGSFIAWKKASGKIVKLLILEDAKRSSATTLKCRASKVKILWIEGDINSIASSWDANFIYTVGEIIEVEDFDEDRWNEYSTGIHFFMNRKLAENY